MPNPRDPIVWCGALTAAFLALMLVRIGIPSKPFFDEGHYVPAAREYLALGKYVNREHPLLGKQLIALGIAILGDAPVGWRLPSVLAGAAALFAGMRALWFASRDRFATLAYGVLIATGFYVFVNARIAMLDIFMVAFTMIAYWQLAAALREPERGRLRLALAGAALGLALAAKWNAAPLLVLPGAAFFIMRLRAGRRRFLTSTRGAPVPGVSLIEAALWLGVLPLAIYAATFVPAFFFAENGIGGAGGPANLIALHTDAIRLQESVVKTHPYMSRWPQWVLNTRSIWYLYEPVDGAQRGIVLIGNPLTMTLGLPAVAWAAYAGIAKRDAAAGAAALLYAVTLGFWILSDKPIQFLYHYFLPSMALLAALALALGGLWRLGYRWFAVLPLAGSAALFAYFYPILSAAPLAEGERAFIRWMWLKSWS
ncbi:phospholipid carrier-dependent glycosyltransferase [Qipengyuania sediminis]|uniref:phospholipid carrier-dependent glycosyltransferase n=1 Tax=Qipengyuania sediminis TaxID=1532023 RepID=UPI0030846B62